MLFPIIKNRNKKVLYKVNSGNSSALSQDNQHFLVTNFIPQSTLGEIKKKLGSIMYQKEELSSKKSKKVQLISSSQKPI